MLKALKNNYSSSKAFKLMYPQLARISSGRSTSCFIYSFVIQMITEKNTVQRRFYQQFQRYFYVKIIVTITPINVVTNLLLSSFCPFLQTKSKNQASSWPGNKIYFHFLFAVCRALFQSYPESNKRFIKGFSFMLLLFVLQFHVPTYQRRGLLHAYRCKTLL